MAPSVLDNPVRGAWAVAGLVITLVVAYVLYTFVGAIAVGIFLYYATRPVHRWLGDRVDHPDVNATLALLVVGLPLLVVLGYAGFIGVREADQFLRQADLQRYRSMVQPYLDIASTGGPNPLDGLRNVIPRVLALASTVLLWGVRLFVIIAVAFYLLRDDQKMADWLRRTFGGEYGVAAFLEGVDEDLSTIYIGNLITIGLTGAVAVVVYYGLDRLAPPGTGVAFPVLLGLVTGVATLVPAVGMKLVYFPYAGFLLWQSLAGRGVPLWFPVVFFVVTLVVVDTIPDVFIRSYVSKGDINMGLMLLTYTLAAVTFGWYGVFLGPIVLVLFLHFLRRVFPNLLGADAAAVVTRDR